MAATALMNLPYFGLSAVLYFFAIHALDCMAIKHFISRFASKISHSETWFVRGVSYIIMVLNYHAAQGAFALYFKKTHGAPVAKSLGTLAFISITDVLLLFTSALLAFTLGGTSFTFQGHDLKSLTRILVPTLYGLYFLWVLFWKNVDKPYLVRVKKYKLIGWILKHDIFLIFREAKAKDYLVIFLMRLPITIMVIGSYNLAFSAFNAHITWSAIFLFMPVVMFVGTLPITPAGFGTGQFFVIEFFKNRVSSPFIDGGMSTAESLLLASSLIWGLANQLLKLLFGLFSLTKTKVRLFHKQSI